MTISLTKLERAKIVIKYYFEDYKYGIFNCRNLVGDAMTTLYRDLELQIDGCYYWGYLEVFGLTSGEFDELYEYYEKLGEVDNG